MGFFSRMGKSKEPTRAKQAGGKASIEEENAAAVKIQTRARGRRARKGFGQMLFAPVQYVMDVGEDFMKSGKEAVQSLAEAVVPKGPPRATDAEVFAATPENFWFTPRKGWEPRPGHETSPHYMMPTAADMEPLFPAPADVIGELKVAVLEAEGLPNMDSLTGHSLTGNSEQHAIPAPRLFP